MDEFTVELTPLARFHLLQRFVGYPGPFKNATESKAFRSAYDRLGLRPIQLAAERNNGQLSARQVNSIEPASFTLTFDEVQVTRAVANAQPRSGAVELVLGPFCDDLDAVMDGTVRVTAAGAAMFDSAIEDWTPPKVPANAQPEQNG